MTSYAEALQEFYSGEVLGEALYSALLAICETKDERRKMAGLLQLETETKAWLRRYLLKESLSILEQASDRDKAAALAAYFATLPWKARMDGLRSMIVDQVIPRYREFAQATSAQTDEHVLCVHMVEHELAQTEFMTRELAGDGNPLEPIEKLLHFPIAP